LLQQGYHNLTTANHVLPDPELTQLGEQQCAKLKDSFPYHSQIELVAASPLRRTIHTALLSFQPVFEANKDFKILCIPEAQETSDVPCDTGSDPAVLQKEFVDRGLPVDISLVHDGWNSKVFFLSLHETADSVLISGNTGGQMGTHHSCPQEQSPRGSKMAQIAPRKANRPCHTWWIASLFDRRLGGW
jgi:hypothetical protein